MIVPFVVCIKILLIFVVLSIKYWLLLRFLFELTVHEFQVLRIIRIWQLGNCIDKCDLMGLNITDRIPHLFIFFIFNNFRFEWIYNFLLILLILLEIALNYHLLRFQILHLSILAWFAVLFWNYIWCQFLFLAILFKWLLLVIIVIWF